MSSSLPSMSSRMLRCEASMPVQSAENPPSIGTNVQDSAPLADLDIDWLMSTALSRCGLTHADACELMKLDPSQWAKQIKSRDNAHVSLQRLAKLPQTFWIELLILLAARLGLNVGHITVEQQLLFHVGDLVQSLARVMAQQQMRRAG